VFLVCYSVANKTSYINVKDKVSTPIFDESVMIDYKSDYQWVPEIRHFCPHTPIMLIGTKSDLKTDPDTLTKLKANNSAFVTTEEAQSLCKQIGAIKHIECSAMRQKKIDTIFQEVISIGKEPPAKSKNRRRCRIL